MLREVLEVELARCDGLEVAAGSREGSDGCVDVVLIDAGCDLPAALSRTWHARDRWPAAKLIVVGLEREDERVVDFIEAGAAAYVLQGSSPQQLVAAIRGVQQGVATCSPQIVGAVLDRISVLSRQAEPASAGSGSEPLTHRESEILTLLAAGLGNKEAGRRLHITVQTVKNHVHRILEKLQVHRRREAVRRAYDLGILAEPHEIPAAGRNEPMRGAGTAGRPESH